MNIIPIKNKVNNSFLNLNNFSDLNNFFKNFIKVKIKIKNFQINSLFIKLIYFNKIKYLEFPNPPIINHRF